MSQAFISYHRAQRKLARLIAHRVAADGHAVWWDRGERPGDSWGEAVSTALANSECVIVIWSKQAAVSPWVLGEATAGYGRGALICVQSDKTTPPSPFDKAPTIDMQDWEGDSVDLAWIRLRDPLRAKMTSADKVAVSETALPPPRPAPVRVGYSSASDLRPPPPAPPPVYDYEHKRGGAPISTLVLLGIAGLGAAGWYYRDDVRAQAEAWQAALTPPAREYAALPEPAAPVVSESMTPLSPPQDVVETHAAEAETPAPAAEQVSVAPARATPPVPVMTRTMDDSFVPAPILRTLPRDRAAGTVEASVILPQSVPVTVTDPGPAAAARVMVRESRFVDVDGTGTQRKTDIWFGPDLSGSGLYVGLANGARAKAVDPRNLAERGCARAALSRNPIPVSELQREGALCLRSSDGAVSAWKVETIEHGPTGRVLRLVAIGS